jgi:hypothetical protein
MLLEEWNEGDESLESQRDLKKFWLRKIPTFQKNIQTLS